MKSFYWLCSFLVLLSSCKSVELQPLRTQTQTTQKDSVSTRKVAKDTLLVVKPREVASLSTLLEKLGSRPITQRTGGATVSLRRNGDRIEADCECEEFKKAITIYQEIIERFMERETKTLEETTVVETKMTSLQKAIFGVGLFTILGIFALAFLYIRRLPKR